jgi:AcrR family transcriptional regulator
VRATTDEQKNERRESILAAASGLYAREEYESISVARIAAEAGVAKGTVFVYFSSKEAIFLDLALRSFEEWFAEIERIFEVGGGKTRLEAEEMARKIVDTLAGRRTMLRLASLSHAILERNVALDESLRFKRAVLDSLARLGSDLHPFFPAVSQERSLSFLLGVYSVVLGATAVQVLPAEVRTALRSEPAYNGLDDLLGRLLLDTLASYIRGFPPN